MGLSVIAKLANTASALTPNGTPEAGTALPGDFAALLSGQTLAALLAQGSSLAAQQTTARDSVSRDTRSTEIAAETTAGNAPQAMDPAALVALMGNPQIQPAIQPTSQTASQPAADATQRGLALATDIASRRTERDVETTAASKPPEFEPPPLNGATSSGNAADAKSAMNTANIAAPVEASGNPPAFAANLTAPTHRPDNAAHQQASVNAPLHTETWPQQFGEKVVWMAKNDLQTAQININPPQLGPVQITLNLSGDQATAVFASPHAEVRQAIESSMPQLRDMLASAGINLGDANVGANLAQQNQNNAFQSPNRAQSTLENAILPANDNAPVAGTAMPLKQGRGLVDLFA